MTDKKLQIAASLFIILTLILGTLPAWAASGPDPDARIEELFNRYWRLSQDSTEPAQAPDEPINRDCPGWTIGQWPTGPDSLFCEQWPYRQDSYEIFFSDRKFMGRSIYGLALHSGDLDPSVTLERFERGVGGFHYSTEQVAAWANAVQDGAMESHTPEEGAFIQKLMTDKLLIRVEGRYMPFGMFEHLIGAAAGTNRTIDLNLNHERIHVCWDEDPGFRDEYTRRWQALTEAERQEAREALSGYNPENEAQLIEEWAVFQNEDHPYWN